MASPRPKRGREEELKGENDPLIAAILQNNVARFQQLWDQIVLESDSGERDEPGERVEAARATAVGSSNVPILRIMASTRNSWMTTNLFTKAELETAIAENDLQLVEFFYTVQLPEFDEALFNTGVLFSMPGRVNHFIGFATTDEMCQLGARLFGFLLRTTTSFDWLTNLYGYPKKPEQITALLKWSAPWWQAQRAVVGAGTPIIAEDTATPLNVSQVVRSRIVTVNVDNPNLEPLQLYRELTSSALWRAGEFMTPAFATRDLKEILDYTKGARDFTAPYAPFVTEWAQYIITQLGGDWTWLFPDGASVEYNLGEKTSAFLAVLFDAVTVPYLANLFVVAWDSVMAQRFLRLAQLLADNVYIPTRANVLLLRNAFPGNVATGGAEVLSAVEERVPLLSRIYRRVALLLRDVVDVAHDQLPLDRLPQLRGLSRRLLAAVAAAEPEHMHAVREVLEETAGFPTPLAEWTAFLPYFQPQHQLRRRPSRLSQAVVPTPVTRRRRMSIVQ